MSRAFNSYETPLTDELRRKAEGVNSDTGSLWRFVGILLENLGQLERELVKARFQPEGSPEPWVYWSARDEHDEVQHYRCTIEKAGELLTTVHRRLAYIAEAQPFATSNTEKGA